MGFFQVGSRFSKTFSFTDINYSIASKDDKTAMFLDYSELLNALDSGASAKITIHNRRIDKAQFEKSLLLPMREDGLDHFRREYNEMLLSKVTGTNNSVVQDRYITITVAKRNIDEARTYFSRVGTDLINHLSQLSSVGRELDAAARLQLFRDFFKGSEPAAFAFDLREHMKKGHSFKDWLCPDSMEFQKDHFRIDERWGRVLYLQDYATYIKDSMIAELCDMDRSLMLSIDVLPVPTDEAVREIQNKLLGVETNAANWQRKQNAANNFSAVLPYDMEQQRKETKEMLDDLTNRDQRMMFGLVTLVHLADTKEQLDSDTETILTVARKHLCQMSTLRWQQKGWPGHRSALWTAEDPCPAYPDHREHCGADSLPCPGDPPGRRHLLRAERCFQEHDCGGSPQTPQREQLSFGCQRIRKSFSAKEEIVSIALSTDDDILILDPESEFGFLTEALGGEVIRVSASSDTHINALDMDKAYGDERNLLIEKSEFILSLFEQLVGAGGVSAKEKSILDRCTYDVYREYMANNYQGEVPTLKDLYQSLLKQPEPEARGLPFLRAFHHRQPQHLAQPTNVDTKARIIAYDIRELGEQLMPIGMLVTLDAIFNRVISELEEGQDHLGVCRRVSICCSAISTAPTFFYKLWKRIRKYNGLVTGLTQNVEELLRSDTARLMLANSEFLILLNQSATDRDELAGLLHISDTQLGYIHRMCRRAAASSAAPGISSLREQLPRNHPPVPADDHQAG